MIKVGNVNGASELIQRRHAQYALVIKQLEDLEYETAQHSTAHTCEPLTANATDTIPTTTSSSSTSTTTTTTINTTTAGASGGTSSTIMVGICYRSKVGP